jgi:hypothetical protein
VEKHPLRLSFSSFSHVGAFARVCGSLLRTPCYAFGRRVVRLFLCHSITCCAYFSADPLLFQKKQKKHLHFLHGSVKIDKLIILIPYFTARRCKYYGQV